MCRLLHSIQHNICYIIIVVDPHCLLLAFQNLYCHALRLYKPLIRFDLRNSKSSSCVAYIGHLLRSSIPISNFEWNTRLQLSSLKFYSFSLSIHLVNEWTYIFSKYRIHSSNHISLLLVDVIRFISPPKVIATNDNSKEMSSKPVLRFTSFLVKLHNWIQSHEMILQNKWAIASLLCRSGVINEIKQN